MTWNIVLRPRNDFKFESKNIILYIFYRQKYETEFKTREKKKEAKSKSIHFKRTNEHQQIIEMRKQ